MSGRPNQKVHIYSLDCAYIISFDCINDFRKHYWPEDIGKRPLFLKKENGCEYEIIDEAEIIALKCRPGREAIRLILAIDSSEYCKAQDQDDDYKPIEVYNLRGDLIAEFKTQRLAGLLCSVPLVRISQQLTRKPSIKNKQVYPGGLIFKYKENDTKD